MASNSRRRSSFTSGGVKKTTGVSQTEKGRITPQTRAGIKIRICANKKSFVQKTEFAPIKPEFTQIKIELCAHKNRICANKNRICANKNRIDANKNKICANKNRICENKKEFM
jgi:hypothetical protein